MLLLPLRFRGGAALARIMYQNSAHAPSSRRPAGGWPVQAAWRAYIDHGAVDVGILERERAGERAANAGGRAGGRIQNRLDRGRAKNGRAAAAGLRRSCAICRARVRGGAIARARAVGRAVAGRGRLEGSG